MTDRPRLRALHALSALVIGAFLILHLSNHVVALTGQGAHVEFMKSIRPIYRNNVVEPLLLAALLFQIVSGLTMAFRGWRERQGRIAWMQAISGLYLAFFILNHTAAVLGGRWLFQLDTDFSFAAAGMHVSPFIWFFFPYYALGVAALFTHVGCAFYWRLKDGREGAARAIVTVLPAVGLVLGLLIAAGLAGWLYPVEIAEPYLSVYR